MVRVAHLSPDAPNIDVYVNDTPVEDLSDVSYGTVSDYQSLPAGSQNLKIYAAGETSEPLIEAGVELEKGSAYTIGAVGLAEDGSLETQLYKDDRSLPAGDNAKLRMIHAAPDVETVDIAVRNGPELFVDLGFPNATGYEEVPAGTYPLEARAAGSGEVVFTTEASLSAETIYTAFATGMAKNGTLSVKLVEDAGAGNNLRGVEHTPDTGGIPLTHFLSATLLIAAGLFILLYRPA